MININSTVTNLAVKNYNFVETNAEKTIFEVGGSSKSTERLIFGNDKRFAINVLVIDRESNPLINLIKKIHAYFWFTRVTGIEGKEVYVNTKSLVKRTLSEVSDIASKANSKEGVSIGWIIERVKAVQQAADKAKVASKKTEDFHTKKEHREIDFDSTIFLVRSAWTKYFLNPETSQFQFNYDGLEYIAKLQDKKMHIIRYGKTVKIGEGGSASIYRLYEVTSGTFKILKHYNHKDPRELDETVNNLTAANPENKFNGIVLRPEVQIAGGYLTKEYTPLDKWLKRDHPIDEKVEVCGKLAEALFELRTKAGFRHGDIKPANIFIDKDENGKLLTRIGDLDFARKISKENIGSFYATTTLYVTGNDNMAIEEAQRSNNLEKYRTATERHDIFSMGIALYTIITGSDKPFEHRVVKRKQRDGKNHLSKGEVNTIDLKLALHNHPRKEQIVNLLKEMLNFDPAKRPTIQQFLDKAEQAFR